MRMTAIEVAERVAGKLVGDVGADVVGFSIDSRTLEPGQCFVAITDERDGHDFVLDAFARGASAAIVQRTIEGAHPLIVVAHPLQALASLARMARDEFAGGVVGITGSTGKTSTKALVAGALSRFRAVHASPASFNNESGLPLTILSAPPDTEVLVCEMGARHPGDIASLCEIARPTVGVVTNVGLAHAELLGDADGIGRAKGELLEALPASGLAVLPADDPAIALASRTEARVVTVGRASTADLVIRDVRIDDELRPRFLLDTPAGGLAIELAVRGEHQVVNAALAAAVALEFGASGDDVVDGLGRVGPVDQRMRLTESAAGVRIIDDSYNANPASMTAALRALARIPAGRRIAVLGEMRELGEHATPAHAQIGTLAADLGIEVVAVGAGLAALADAAQAAGAAVHVVSDANAAAAFVTGTAGPGDAVLVKASRAVGLEVVVASLEQEAVA